LFFFFLERNPDPDMAYYLSIYKGYRNFALIVEAFVGCPVRGGGVALSIPSWSAQADHDG
jgi:hypothetical protein